MGVMVVTGSASGIGRATAARLAESGHQVIGVDIREADVVADLSRAAGRRAMVEQVIARAPNGVHGVLAAAGVSALDHPGLTLGLNYFGAVATLEGLRPHMVQGARAVAVGSTSALLPTDDVTVCACLAGDEDAAIAAAEARPEATYMSSKRALSLWLRRTAVSPSWAGSGVLLNGVAPGVVETAMTAPLLKDPAMRDLIAQTNPMAVEDFAEPGEIAELIAYLLTFKGHYLLGQMIFIDGGTDALMRPDAF